MYRETYFLEAMVINEVAVLIHINSRNLGSPHRGECRNKDSRGRERGGTLNP